MWCNPYVWAWGGLYGWLSVVFAGAWLRKLRFGDCSTTIENVNPRTGRTLRGVDFWIFVELSERPLLQCPVLTIFSCFPGDL
jgi:hypothetical protein